MYMYNTSTTLYLYMYMYNTSTTYRGRRNSGIAENSGIVEMAEMVVHVIIYSDIRSMLGVLALLGLYQDVFVLTQARNNCILWFA